MLSSQKKIVFLNAWPIRPDEYDINLNLVRNIYNNNS